MSAAPRSRSALQAVLNSSLDYEWDSTGLDWSSESSVTLRLREAAASTDATLSGLAVNDGNADLTLTPTFASGMYTYTASVVSTVAEVTVTPTKNDDGATIEYLDASNMTLADNDTSAAGQQVALDLGDNVIKVKVTAEDGNATQTYTVTVTRVSPTCTLNTGDLWCGVVTVGTFETSGSATAYGFSSSVGNLSDKEFSVGTNDYTIDSITVGAAGTSNAGALAFSLTSDLTAADKAKLVLHVGSAEFAFSDAVGPFSSSTYSWLNSGQDWSSVPNVTLRLRDSPISMDATLSGLAVKDGSTDVKLTPTFASGTTSYTASVANAVAEVTVTPTKNHARATIEYLNASDMTLADAGTAAGQQVVLAVGANVIKVKVTAEDGTTTRTYTVTATRAPTCTPDTAAGDIWCGVVTVGTFETSGSATAYGFSSSVGNLSDKEFSVGTNDYTIDSIHRWSGGDFQCRCLGLLSHQRPHRRRSGKAGAACRQRRVRVQRCGRSIFQLYLQLAEFRPGLVVGAERHAAAAGWVDPRLDGRDAERSGRQRRQRGPDADADLRIGQVHLHGVGGEHRRRGDGDADEERHQRDDRISGRERRDARRRQHHGWTGHQVAVAEGDTVIKVKVTAEDGNATQTYMVTVNRAAAVASTDATLSDLVVNDGNSVATDLTLTPGFASGMYTYTASVARPSPR